MKLHPYALAILALIFTGCTSVSTKNAAGGKSSYTAIGGDTKAVSIGPDGATIGENKNSGALKAVTPLAE